MNAAFDPRNFLANLSNAPGVYRMLNADNEVLYVGKAGNLKKRVSSYFRKSGLSPKTQAMMNQVADMEVTVTHTESEALLLENNLIKTLRPRYNILLRDDKSYPYIYLSEGHPFPRLGYYRGARREKGRYFGPYPSAGAVRESLSLLQKVFPVRQCKDSFFRNRSRPCLQYQIKRCTAPCVGLISEEDYAEDVRQAVWFLEGKSQTLIEELGRKMEQASERREYELAAVYRDRIASLGRVQERQYISAEMGDADVVAVHAEQGKACVEVVYVRGGRNLGSKSYFPKLGLDATPEQVLGAFLSQHYLGRAIPAEVLVNQAVPDRELLEAEFSREAGHRVTIATRVRGTRARWLRMAELNAADALRRHLAGRATIAHRLETLQEALALESIPERIECIDVSHTMGEATVASCVVFDANGPVKSDYRRYNITGIAAGDDYGAMEQVLTRRFKRLKEGEGVYPDLLLIDGGKGQLKVAENVVAELQVDGVTLVGVAKGRERKPGLEQLFLSAQGQPTILPGHSPALHLIQQVRDEAHRFAITGHRQRRGKTRNTSTLEQIPGIGDKRRQALLKHLGGLQEVARAGVEDLARVPGISPELAQRVYDLFHS
jgi:excinuclease ABC subunit C